jgi:hypothetical protein
MSHYKDCMDPGCMTCVPVYHDFERCDCNVCTGYRYALGDFDKPCEQLPMFDPTITQPVEPARFDVAGNLITGEHDKESTPPSGISMAALVDLTEFAYLEDSDTGLAGQFCAGVGIGIIVFAVCYLAFVYFGGW